jgi:multiple sugar transport system substrate-binding protein
MAKQGTQMTRTPARTTSRRDFLRLAAGAAAVGPFFLFSPHALASPKPLKIAKWAHFLPEFDDWFVNVMAKEWGKKNNAKVTVDLIPVEEIRDRAFAEVKAGKGHDIFIFPWSPAEFYQHVIDHAGIYQTVASKVGAIQTLAFRSTRHLAAKKYFAFADYWMPSPLHYFVDYWGQIGMPFGPVHYAGLLSGGRMIRDKFGVPSGMAFSPTLEGNVTLHTILYARRAFILDSAGNVMFNKRAFSVSALEYIHAIVRDSGTPEQLTWGSGGSARAMIGHKGSIAINAISLVRTAEKESPDVGKQLWLVPPLKGTSGMGITALPHVTNCSVVWNFSQNQPGASKFIADLVDSSRTGYEKSRGCNFPIFPKTVPDIVVRLQKDPQGGPFEKYMALKDALHWTPNLGAPGITSPAYMEIFNTSLVPKMVAQVVSGQKSAQDAVAAGSQEMQRIVDKWKQAT